MMIEFMKEKIPAIPQSAIKVFYENKIIGEYFTDVTKLSEDHQYRGWSPIELWPQTRDYAYGIENSYLCNFLSKFKRFG